MDINYRQNNVDNLETYSEFEFVIHIIKINSKAKNIHLSWNEELSVNNETIIFKVVSDSVMFYLGNILRN